LNITTALFDFTRILFALDVLVQLKIDVHK